MRRMILRTLMALTLCATFFFFSFRAYERSTDGFDPTYITYKGPICSEWISPPLTSSEKILLDQILEHPFEYIGKGAQSYVFGSREGNYVIKFFKFKHLRSHGLMDALPSWTFLKDYRQRKAARKERLIASVFGGYRLAYEKHREESGLLFFVLNPSCFSSCLDMEKRVVLYDKKGRRWDISLKDIPFVIQERVDTTRTIMKRALEAGDLSLAKERFSQVVALYRLEYAKGIYDRDHGVLHNTGFIGDRPIHLDVGKLTANPAMYEEAYWRSDLEVMAKRFLAWVEKEYPKYFEELSFYVQEKVRH